MVPCLRSLTKPILSERGGCISDLTLHRSVLTCSSTTSGYPGAGRRSMPLREQKKRDTQCASLFLLVAEVGPPPHGLAFSLRRKCCGRFGGSDTPSACHSLPPHPPSYSPFGLITRRPCDSDRTVFKKRTPSDGRCSFFGCGGGT